VRGLVELQGKLRDMPDEVKSAARGAVKAETSEVAEDLRMSAPVLTGELRAGIRERYRQGGLSGQAVSTARHTTFVVNGTSDTEAQDFMTPAGERSRQRFPARAREAVSGAVRKAAKG